MMVIASDELYPNVQYTVYSVHCRVYTVQQYTVYTVECILYNSILWKHEEAVTGQCKGDMDRGHR